MSGPPARVPSFMTEFYPGMSGKARHHLSCCQACDRRPALQLIHCKHQKSQRTFAGNFVGLRHNHLDRKMITRSIREKEGGCPSLQNLQFSTKHLQEIRRCKNDRFSRHRIPLTKVSLTDRPPHARYGWSSCFETFSTFEQLLRKTAEVTSNIRAGNRIVQSLAHHRQYSMEIFGQVLF